ncbi:MAG: PIN domain nuclease [Cytophagales bacterium]|nr:PIN domain nuclease [Cytophagales bacterium]
MQGIKHDKIHKSCQDSFSAIPMLSANMWDASTGAAIYRKLRKLGTTIRKPNDCLIAWYAISFDLTLVHNDPDFENIARHSPLKFL